MSGAEHRTLVVGAGQAGVQLASSLREHGYDGPITIVGEEPYLPYKRPPLSKAILLTGETPADFELRSREFYAQAAIELVEGERVSSLEIPDEFPHRLGIARTTGGRTITFDRLALTVGGRPRRLDIDGAQLDGICYLHRIDEAVELRRRIAAARSVAVVGGGFIGLEAAAAAVAAGRPVTVLEAGSRLLERSVAPEMSAALASAHARRGVTLRPGAKVVGFGGADGRVGSVLLADGSTVPADLVVVGVGLKPSVDLARSAGLECTDQGIVVDEWARTSRHHVVAAGDCTVVHDVQLGTWTRLESVQNAVAQARRAAATLMRIPDLTPALPWFWSDQGDLKLQIAGLSTGHDATVVRADPEHERLSVLYYEAGRLIAIDALNAPFDYMVVRKALQDGANIDPELAADGARSLRDLVARDVPVSATA